MTRFVNLYPVWIVLSSVLAYLYPPILQWFDGNFMIAALAIVMLGMGLTLTIEDFRSILKMPGSVLLGVSLQYLGMPLIGWGIGILLDLDKELAVGLILVTCCPGGTASNVITFLAQGNLALSIILTTVSTFLAIILTPLLCEFYAGEYVPVDAFGLFLTTVKVVLIPVSLGVFLNYKYPSRISTIAQYGPLASVVAIIFISGSIVSQSSESITDNLLILFASVSMVHGLGFGLGYLISRMMRFHRKDTIAISIEVGMQNGGLAAVLAKQNFPLYPLAAVPAVFSSVIQTIIGGILASYWNRTTPLPKKGDELKKIKILN